MFKVYFSIRQTFARQPLLYKSQFAKKRMKIHYLFWQIPVFLVLFQQNRFQNYDLIKLYLKAFNRITCPCNIYPIIPHFYIVKLVCAGVNPFFLFWVPVLMYPQSMLWAKYGKYMFFFILKAKNLRTTLIMTFIPFVRASRDNISSVSRL